MGGACAGRCEVSGDDPGRDGTKAEALVTRRTKALVPLHFAGIPCDRAGVYSLARANGLRVIEDACHAFGSEIGGTKIGSDGDIVR